MLSGNHFKVAGKSAILGALLCGSAVAAAQEVTPPAVQPTIAPPLQQAPAPVVTPQAAPVVQPPPVVRTVPDAEPVAQAEAERPAPRRRAAVAPAVRATPRAEVAPVAAPVAVNEPAAVTDPLPAEETGGVTAIVEDSVAIAPVPEPAAETSGMATEDWTLAGGIAAALAALGLGTLAMRRRRRAVNDNEVQTVAVVPAAAPEYPAPLPINQDPVFQRPASSTPVAEPFIARPTSIPVAEPVIQRRPLTTRPDVPVTDPLFSQKISAGPITDPMFAPKTAVEPPITDPLFAKHPGYAGRFGQTGAAPVREPQLIN